MRIVAIDASALGGGSVSASVEAAARAAETAGATVHRVRLYSMPTGHCVSEAGLAVTRGFEETIAATIDGILDSDGVILGIPSTNAGPNAATRALLRRLAACFAGHCLERGYHGRPTRLSPGRRVGLLTSSTSPAALASPEVAALGTTLRVRRCLSRGGLTLLGHVAIADVPGHPLTRDRAMTRSGQLGRSLATHLVEEHAVMPSWIERRPVGPRGVRARVA